MLCADVRAGKVRLWHGGAPDLRVGEYVLPPAVTGARGMRHEIAGSGFSRSTASDHLVYVTTDRRLAAAIAAYWGRRESGNGRGWLYRVELDDEPLAPDDDLPRGPFISFQLSRARIAAVLDRGVDPNDARYVRDLERFVRTIG